MNSRILLFLSLSLPLLSFALKQPEIYSSGPEFCYSHIKAHQKNFGKWVAIPSNYNNPEKRDEALFTWTNKKFNPSLKTLIFISGGPGNHSHNSLLDLENWNLIFFDQRGIACSKPSTRERHLDKTFYSSQFTARDIEEIRKSYSVEQVSLYGVSYGTVPATIYASLFPERTRSVILEGTIFSSGKLLIQPERRIEILQKFFDSLSPKTQDRILDLSAQQDLIPEHWFSAIGMYMLYLDNPLEKYKLFLDNTLWDDQVVKDLLVSLSQEPALEEPTFEGSQVAAGMVGCQELGMNLSKISFYSRFQGRKLISDGINSKSPLCKALGFSLDIPQNLYLASQYPVKVPVFYIQGAMDGSTVLDQAYFHANLVAQKKAFMLIADNGGHQPLLGGMESGYDTEPILRLKKAILEKILSESFIDSSDVSKLNSQHPLKWRTMSVKDNISHDIFP